jgi:hypothetical protein
MEEPTQVHTYIDTPAKRAVRELKRDWMPLFGSMQEVPPFALMHEAAHKYDNTSFIDHRRDYAMPDIAPSGHGMKHHREHRETSHFVGKMLDNISPSLGTFYRGGHHNEDQHKVAESNYSKASTRNGALGGAIDFTHNLTIKPRYTEPASHSAPNHYYASEIFTQ